MCVGAGCDGRRAALGQPRVTPFPRLQRRLPREGPGRGPLVGMGILNSVPFRRGS